MSYQLDTKTPGVLVYHLTNILTKLEVTNLVQEVEKGLGQGKCKIILEFSKEAATGALGYGFVQNAFIKVRALAQKMNGEVLYVLPAKIAARVEGTYPELALALQIVTAGSGGGEEKSKLVEDLKKQVVEQTAQIEKLTAALEGLAAKNKELAEIVSQPTTDLEMKAAIEHYRNLASEVQAITPIVRTK